MFVKKFLFVLKSPVTYWITAAIVLIIGFFLRGHMILSGDFWFTPDQARDMVLSRDVVNFHKLILIGARSGVDGIFHGPLWIYMLSIPFAIFNGDPQKVSYFYIFFSLIIVLSGFVAAYKLYNKWTALLLLIVLSFSSGLYSIVSLTTEAHGLFLIMVGYLLSMLLFIRGKDKAIIAAVLLAGLAFNFQAAFAIFLLPYTVLTALVLRRSIFKVKNLVLYVLVYVGSLIFLILFELRHQFLETHAVLKMLFSPATLKPIKGYEQYGNLLFRIQDRLIGIANVPNSFLAKQDLFLYVLVVLAIALAFYLLLKKKNYAYLKEFIFLLAFPIFVYLLYIIYPLPIWGHYTFAILIVAAFLFVLSALVIWKETAGKVIITAFVLYTAYLTVGSFVDLYKTKYVPKTDGSYINQLRVVDGVFKTANGKHFSYFVYAPQVYTYGMDYLLWWRGKNVYGYTPTNIKEPGLMFLIMYPYDQDSSAHGYWIKNKIRTNAKIISTKIYSGNITVEERLNLGLEPAVDPNYYLNTR